MEAYPKAGDLTHKKERDMGWGILQGQLSRFVEFGEQAEGKSAWKRRKGFNLPYTFVDAIKSAFGIFLFQYLAMLGYQESLDRYRVLDGGVLLAVDGV